MGEEDRDLDARHVRKAGHGSGAGIAGGCRQHQHLAASGLAGRLGHQHGQNRKRHVLEGARGTVEQFQQLEVAQIDERHGAAVRLVGELGEQVLDGRLADCFGNVVEKRVQRKPLGLFERIKVIKALKALNCPGHEKATIGRETAQDGFKAGRRKDGTRAGECHYLASSSICFSERVANPAAASTSAALVSSANRNTSTAFSPWWKAKA